MVETFYDALGVARDADEETIGSAYREAVKAVHPDVSDSPDATDRFKRLTTAKEALLDETERSRYDRLGHGAYLRRRGDCAGWSAPAPDENTVADVDSAGGASNAARAYADGGYASGGAPNREGETRQSAPPTGGGPATSYYGIGVRAGPGERNVTDRFDSVRSLAPWVVLDAFLVTSTVATAWLILAWGSLSPLSVVLASVLCLSMFGAASLHLSSRVCA